MRDEQVRMPPEKQSALGPYYIRTGIRGEGWMTGALIFTFIVITAWAWFSR